VCAVFWDTRRGVIVYNVVARALQQVPLTAQEKASDLK
jgi:hypothetical protein